MVVTPGVTRAFTWSSTCRTMRPLCRIRSISADDLHTIAILLRVMIFQYPENLFRDGVHRQISVHRDQSACALVVVRDRTSLLLVCRESGLNYLQPIVIAGHQLLPRYV